MITRTAKQFKGLMAFFAKARAARGNVTNIKKGTHLLQVREARRDLSIADQLIGGPRVTGKADPKFVHRHMEHMSIGPTGQRNRVAKTVRDLRSKLGPKEARKALSNIATRFKKTGHFDNIPAEKVDDYILPRAKGKKRRPGMKGPLPFPKPESWGRSQRA